MNGEEIVQSGADRRSAIVSGVFASRIGAVFKAVSSGLLLGALAAVVFRPGLAVMLGVLGVTLLRAGGAVEYLFRARRRATLEVTGGVLVVDSAAGTRAGVRKIPLERMQRGQVIPKGVGSSARVVVRDRGGVVLDAELDDRAAARGLLRDLKLSARERPATFSFYFGLRVTVGADGVLVAWPLLGRRRFIRYADIDSVDTFFDRIVIRLLSGKRYSIGTGVRRDSQSTDEHLALIERIEDAREAYRADVESGSLAGVLRRGGRTALAWVKDLRAMADSGGGGYRAATLPKEALWRIALDPTEAEETRIGASLTLRGALDDDDRARLRLAAEASASPRVRVVLAGAADGLDDEDLGDAIATAARLPRV